MNALATTILTLQLTHLSVSDVRNVLNTVIVTKEDATLYTVGQLEITLNGDLDKQRLVLGTLNSVAAQDPLVDAYRMKFVAGKGLPFNLPNTQMLIDQLAVIGNWPDDLKNAIKSIGIETGPQWQASGLSALPTEEECQIALDQITVNEHWAHIKNDIVPPMLSAGNSWSEILIAIQEAL